MTELKQTKLFAIPIPGYLSGITLELIGNTIWNCQFQEIDRDRFKTLPIGEWKILGTVTKDEIDFDVEPFVGANIVWNGVKNVFVYKDYINDYGNFLDTKQSFYSLLKANGIDLIEKQLIIQKL